MIGCWVVHTFGVLGHVAFKNCTCKLDKIYIFSVYFTDIKYK